jgi:microsomal dipeptidase-like Zn-dependent dipeptidase
VYAVCDNARNAGDRELLLIRNTGGLVGIALFQCVVALQFRSVLDEDFDVFRSNICVWMHLFSPAVCDTEDLVGNWVKSVVHAIELLGVEYVALGSDWDGAVRTSVDASQTRILYSALLYVGGLSERDAKAVMFGNTQRFFRSCLPRRSRVL